MNTMKTLLNKCAPMFFSVAACSLLSNCDSNYDASKEGAALNLEATADAFTTSKLYDYISFEASDGEAEHALLDFASQVKGTLHSTSYYQNNATATDISTRVVLSVVFQHTYNGQHEFALDQVTTGIFTSQFAEHVDGIYAGTFAFGGAGINYGFESITRQITLNHDGNFDLAELNAIAEEFNGYTALTEGVDVEDTTDIVYVDSASKQVYIPDYSTYTFTITSTNQDRIRGVLSGTYVKEDKGRVIGWRAPTSSEIGDAGTYRLEPTNLVPYLTSTIINVGDVESGEFELRLVAGSVDSSN